MQRRRVDWTEGGKGRLFYTIKQVCKPLQKGAHIARNAPASGRITPASYVSRNTCLEYKFHVRAHRGHETGVCVDHGAPGVTLNAGELCILVSLAVWAGIKQKKTELHPREENTPGKTSEKGL